MSYKTKQCPPYREALAISINILHALYLDWTLPSIHSFCIRGIMVLLGLLVFVTGITGITGTNVRYTSPLGRRDDGTGASNKMLQDYRTHISQLNSTMTQAAECYDLYMEKVRREGPVEGGLHDCNGKDDAVGFRLGEARKIAFTPDFPLNQLFRLELPDLTDGRKSGRGPWTEDVDKRLREVRQKSKLADEGTDKADRVQKYRVEMAELDRLVNEATACYGDYGEKIRKDGPDASIKACETEYDATQSQLGKARRVAEEPGFPRDWLFDAKLPNVMDGRKSQQGEWTADLQRRLEALTKSSGLATTDEGKAGLLQTYRTQVAEFMKTMSSATACYADYTAKVDQGSFPGGTEACDGDYDASQAQLGVALETARQAEFPEDWLFDNGLPDVLDTRDSNQGNWTQDMQAKLQGLKEASTAAIETGEELQRLNTTVFDEVAAAVNQSVVETAYTLAQYVGLRNLLKEEGTAESAKDVVKRSLATFMTQVLEQNYDELVDGALGESKAR